MDNIEKINEEYIDMFRKQRDIYKKALELAVKDGYTITKFVGIAGNELEELPIKTLLVEDGSVNTDELEKIGYKIITYRQGSKTPKLLKE